MAEGVGRTVAALGTTQTLAWASSYYLPAMLAVPMAQSLGVGVSTVFAAFSAALVVSAILGPHAGRAIDRWGRQAGSGYQQPDLCSRPRGAGICPRIGRPLCGLAGDRPRNGWWAI